MTQQMFSPLEALSPLDGRYHNTTKILAPYFSEGALMQARIAVEITYLLALSDIGIVRPLTQKEKKQLRTLQKVTPSQIEKIKEIEEKTRHDIKAMEKGIREFVKGTSLENITEMIHFGLTSEDINNLAYRILFEKAKKAVFLPTFEKVIDQLCQQARIYKSLPMLARTHGQDAVPTTVGKELINFAIRLQKEVVKLKNLKLEGKLNGAVGNYNAPVFVEPRKDWIRFSKKFIKSLGLTPNLFTTQVNTPEDIITLLQSFSRINGIFLNLNRDMWRYISDGWLIQQVKKGEIGSSTMPQKVNPIDFENSEGNIKIGNALLDGIIHGLATSRLQRDLSGSTIMRNVGAGLTYSFLAAEGTLTGLSRVSPSTSVIINRLNSNWAILTEAVQTILRKHRIEDAYSLVASLSHGQEISEKEWKKWVEKLPVEKRIKKSLDKLTPKTYVGYAAKLTDMALLEIQKVQ